MDAPDSVVEALELLRADGYEAEFQLVDGCLRCDVSDRDCPATEAVVERLFRFEGPSDPGDEMVVFGLRDPSPVTGVLASGFGPPPTPGAGPPDRPGVALLEPLRPCPTASWSDLGILVRCAGACSS
jgi:hypothetical protein